DEDRDELVPLAVDRHQDGTDGVHERVSLGCSFPAGNLGAAGRHIKGRRVPAGRPCFTKTITFGRSATVPSRPPPRRQGNGPFKTAPISSVMPGPVPCIHVYTPAQKECVDGRHQPGHDNELLIPSAHFAASTAAGAAFGRSDAIGSPASRASCCFCHSA